MRIPTIFDVAIVGMILSFLLIMLGYQEFGVPMLLIIVIYFFGKKAMAGVRKSKWYRKI